MAGIYDYLKSPTSVLPTLKLRRASKTTTGKQGVLPAGEPSREEWCLAGLIHDIDYSGEFKNEHPQKTKKALARYGLDIPETVLRIVKAHAPELTGVKPQNKAEWAIMCADSLTGLIVASALVLPSKKLADVKLPSVLKRFKEPKFAAGTRREEISQCANSNGLNIPLEKFIDICLVAMQNIAKEISL